MKPTEGPQQDAMASYGEDNSAVKDKLHNVVRIESNYAAFAALLADGSVVTWGRDLRQSGT